MLGRLWGGESSGDCGTARGVRAQGGPALGRHLNYFLNLVLVRVHFSKYLNLGAKLESSNSALPMEVARLQVLTFYLVTKLSVSWASVNFGKGGGVKTI